MKTRFKKYSIHIKKKGYTVLIPEGIEDMTAIAGYAKDEPFVGGNRKVMEAFLTAYYLLGLGKEVILYFPARQCEGWKCEAAFWYREEWRKELFYDTDIKDVVFLNHNIQFPAGHWEKALSQMKRQKPQILSIHYQERKVAGMFRREGIDRCNIRYRHKKEYAREKIRNYTVFYVLSKAIARICFYELEEMLEGEIEAMMESRGKEYWTSPEWIPMSIGTGSDHLMLMCLDYKWYMDFLKEDGEAIGKKNG